MNFSFNEEREGLNKINGVLVGVVTDNNDPENLGRVKLTIKIREHEDETDWARVATLMGGKNMGSYIIPEVGDEVLVAFHLGEFRNPYVIGSLWSKKSPPPSVDKKDNNIRILKTKSGHQLVFDDKNSGNIEIKTKAGQVITLDDQGNKVKIAEKSGDNSIEIVGGTSNQVTLKSGQTKISINKMGEVSIEGSTSLKLKAPQIKIEASATLDIKAGGMLNIKSDGIVNIKGSLAKIN